jgi:hypothetical protein
VIEYGPLPLLTRKDLGLAAALDVLHRVGDVPALDGFWHTPVGTSARNTIRWSSRLLLPLTNSGAV